jgi:hypothetical protein
LIAWLLVGHVAELKKNGLSNEVAATYVTTALFHSGQDRFFTFMFKSTTHLFRYFFSNGTVGVAGLILFLLGIGLLLKDRTPSDLSRSSSCALAVLLLLPFIITLALGLAGLYPYGGIRHDTILAPFAMAGISIPLARWKMSPHWVKPVWTVHIAQKSEQEPDEAGARLSAGLRCSRTNTSHRLRGRTSAELLLVPASSGES